MKRSPMKRKARKPEEAERIYGSEERQRWLRGLPFANCHITNRVIHIAHAVSGGVGRKADCTETLPLCEVCHGLQHAKGWSALGKSREWARGVARKIHRLWSDNYV